MKILLVEDNTQLNRALSAVLKRNSYIVDSAFDGEDALQMISEYKYDVIILDIMLPSVNGLEVLKRARDNKVDTPILMLSAKSTLEDKISGLDLGADDYLTKPFQVDELLARIRALVRRKGNKYDESKVLSFKDLSLDLSTLELKCGDKSVILMNKEMQIMQMLLLAQGKMVTLDTISKGAWDIEAYSTSENIWVFISYLRKKIDKIQSNVKIKSIRYQGYYLE